MSRNRSVEATELSLRSAAFEQLDLDSGRHVRARDADDWSILVPLPLNAWDGRSGALDRP